MPKIAYRFAVATAFLGLLLFLPYGYVKALIYSEIRVVHIIFGTILGILLVKLIKKHVIEELWNPFRQGFKKWNGFKLLLYLVLAILSGIVIVWLQIRWVMYFHGFIGLWALLVGWKHKK